MRQEEDVRALFTIQIQFRQNATWQGTVMWMDEKRSRRFRSEAELLELMQEALEFQSAQEPMIFSEKHNGTWEEET